MIDKDNFYNYLQGNIEREILDTLCNKNRITLMEISNMIINNLDLEEDVTLIEEKLLIDIITSTIRGLRRRWIDNIGCELFVNTLKDNKNLQESKLWVNPNALLILQSISVKQYDENGEVVCLQLPDFEMEEWI